VATAQAARNGASAAEVTALAEDLAGRTRVWAALDTLENLKKGGRIGGAKALVASVLSIKPIIEVRGGVVEEAGRQRTRSKAWSALVDHVAGLGPLDAVAVMHASVPDIDRLVADLRKVVDPGVADRLVVGEIGAVIGAHGGIGTVGVVAQVARP
jgi:DegV family protein with EDD domain